MKKRPLRILHVLNHCQRGNGHVHVAVDLACEQSSLGHNVFVISRGGTYVQLLEQKGVAHNTIESFSKKWGFGLYSLFRKVLEIKPDIIHAHMMASAVLCYIVSRILRIKLITTMHNSFDPHSFLMKLGDRVVAVSSAEQDKLLSTGYCSRKVRLVYNGPIGTARSNLTNDLIDRIPKYSIMTLSGLHSRKRVDLAIRSFSRVHSDFEEWRLIVVGEGPDEGLLKTLTTDLGINSKVSFVGSALNPTALLEQASIFLALSDAEPFGLVVVEARAAGCAIIVTNVGGMPEIVDFGNAGQIVEKGDYEKVAYHLRQLMSDNAKLEYWQAASLRGVEAYTTRFMAHAYDAVYYELLVE